MHMIEPPRTPEQDENDRKMMRELAASAEKHAAAVKAWKASHPPCPHCGHQEPVPPHIAGLQMWTE